MSANSLNADGLEELLEEAEFVKDTGRTKDEGDFSMIGDALMMAKKDESPDSELSLPAAGPSSAAPRGVDKKLLQKHVDIVKNVKLPAKMSREKIGMAEKLTKNDKLEDDSQPSKVGADAGADDSTSIQIRQILQVRLLATIINKFHKQQIVFSREVTLSVSGIKNGVSKGLFRCML